jgi:large subunit ribosomal protein L18
MRSVRKRRLQARTDYKARFGLLKSGSPRLVVRKTNRYILVQLVTSIQAQDTVVVSASSRELLLKGWPEEQRGSLKSLPAAYLTGMLVVKKSKNKISQAILDIGMQRNIHKSRLYAVLQGARDAGCTIAHTAEILPGELLTKHQLAAHLALKEKL